MSTPTLPAHTALVMLRGLASALAQEQRRRALSLRLAAEQIGVPKSVLHATLNGAQPKLDTVIKCLEWLDSAKPAEPPDTLTPAARRVLDRLIAAHGYGQAWLRVEQHSYGVVLPDGAGTLGELARVTGTSWATWGELEAAGLVRRGLPTLVPPARGPRNRNRTNDGWPVEIVTEQETA